LLIRIVFYPNKRSVFYEAKASILKRPFIFICRNGSVIASFEGDVDKGVEEANSQIESIVQNSSEFGGFRASKLEVSTLLEADLK